ncbi:ribosyldihydronicotinamide dehydrogenase [quinone] isoform X1 [Callorhinus ursinus]|uniref:Ribosyldihydronicotinamide dehydrogenase [quinone] isoform X1 n=1 Tax=Callorhinus ursinus TaxID=34884 RepID=A0A3Q7QXR8_CALUR|nr:ribosyldihydronicotinamide dehydrogenase [quinone] isoform X1 [Callorhinus ursinus]
MAGKKVLIVYAHQEPRSINGSLKKVAMEELSRQGCTITVSDLYAMDFEPRATRKDVIGALSNPEFFNYGVEVYEAFKKRSLASDITDEQKKVQEADLVIFQSQGLLPLSQCPAELPSTRPPHLLKDQPKGAVPGGHRATCNGNQDHGQLCPLTPPSPCPHCMSLLVPLPGYTRLPSTWEEEDSGIPSGSADLQPEAARSICLSLVLCPQFPLYWFGMPAILKGWMDRVLCQGFAFDIPGFYDSGFLKNKFALLSLTTGSTAEMYTRTGISGDFRYFLWPLQHGALHFCGFKILAPQMSFAPEIASEEERKAMVASWAQRLKTIWEEEPIDCTPPWYFGQ